MLKRLRWQLTLIYLMAAVGLVSLLGGGSYLLLRLYSMRTTDLAMQYKIAVEFRKFSVPLPPELVKAEQIWLDNTARMSPGSIAVATAPNIAASNSEDEHGEGESSQHEMDESREDAFDGSVSAIFANAYTANGIRINFPGSAPVPIIKNEAAITNALQNGYDWRTIRLEDGTRVRLLTYRTSGSEAPPVIQVGRLLTDEDRLFNQYLTGLFILGGIVSMLMGVISWWMSGRSLGPAQKAWDQQQVFISNASHELRTPLTLIRATADYGSRDQSDPGRKDFFADIIKECDYMGHLVDDLLILSRLDTHRLKLERDVVLLPELLSEIERQITKLAQERGVNLSLDNPHGQIWGDPIHLRQVLLILLDNALRFTPRGGVIHIDAHPQGKMVQINVADSGSGIPPEHVPHVFERFYQVNPANDESRSNGLGLSIAKALIEAQGGKINLESWLGKGTRVTLSLPNAAV